MNRTSTLPITARPCAKCPFLGKFKGDDDYLRPGRRYGIIRGMMEGGGEFPCHEHVVHDDSECDGESDDCVVSTGPQCAGAALVLLRAERDNQMLRIMERIGALDTPSFLDRNADVELWSFEDCERDGLEDEEEAEPCNTVGDNCIAPAGFMSGGGVIRGTESADCECRECGEPVCSECISEDGLCGTCSDWGE